MPPDPPAKAKKRPRRPTRRWLRGAELAYLGFALAVLLAVRVGGDRWGWATLLSYGPRWTALLPATPLLAWAGWRRRVPWATLAGVALIAGPVLRFNVPLGGAGGPTALRVLTFNTEGEHCDAAALDRLVADVRPDLVALQEWRDAHTLPEFAKGDGWHVRHEWGVMLASRRPILQSQVFEGRDFGGEGRVVGCELAVPGGATMWAFSAHLETPRRGFEPLLDGREGAWAGLAKNVRHRDRLSRVAAGWVAETAAGGGGPVPADVVIAGDFNLVGDGRIFRGSWSYWSDAFEAAGWGYGFTKAQPLWSLRIDHVLAGDAWRATRSWVGPDLGSDHLPLVAEFTRVH